MSVDVKIENVSNAESTIVVQIDKQVILWNAVATTKEINKDTADMIFDGPTLAFDNKVVETNYKVNNTVRTIDYQPMLYLLGHRLLKVAIPRPANEAEKKTMVTNLQKQLKDAYPDDYNKLLSVCVLTNSIVQAMFDEEVDEKTIAKLIH
ncbi:hypothetical protein [Limosilactobacillus mucosae]|uniref:Uncharacterized protein n=1 Tax=Limosilactobacillus mucosae TaxID=97478 RepID=A0AAJ1M7R9_LIMMU|nr:hypothetical protein [Limosilactobacillus mucosae]MDC2826961.1 hypothetical protein [Limosilactobacillus mucosae]MDC2834676.1 hypothetical protein [Limosilactobacillus mucosae]